MTTTEFPALEALQALGLTEIEALVYAYLLGTEPSTGYRISHDIGKPTANTYKAIVSLQQQGAVQVDEGESRLVRAVPAEEFLAQLDRRFRDRREQAAEALAELGRESADDRVYALKSVPQVLERARAMLARARGIVLGDLFPGVVAVLREDLQAAAGRGVRVVVKVYSPTAIEGVEIIPQLDGTRVFERWPGQQLSLVVDAEEHLLALLDDPLAEVHQAVWSCSTFLSCLHHNHLAMEHLVTLHVTAREVSAEAADAAFQEHLALSVLGSGPRGLDRLQTRYGTRPLGKETSS